VIFPHCFTGLVGNEATSAAVKRVSKVEREGNNPFIDSLSHHMLSPSLQFSTSISLVTHTHTGRRAWHIKGDIH